MKLGASSFSFWHFTKDKYPIEKVIRRSVELGLDGIEIIPQQMEEEGKAYIYGLKNMAIRNGIDIYCFSPTNNFVSPDKEQREAQIKETIHSIELAYDLGAPLVRIFAGRWGKLYKEAMKTGGVEQPIEGYTDDDAFDWIISAIGVCLKRAEELGITLVLENHFGLTRTVEGVLRILDAFDSKYFGACLDVGNQVLGGRGDPKDMENWQTDYEGIDRICSKAALVHAKTYFGGGMNYIMKIDYKKIAEILKKNNFNGYVSLEFEGNEDPETAVPKSIDLLKRDLGIS